MIKEMLIRHEGLRLKPYLDSVGKLTIGIGRNLDDRGITKDKALYLLKNDIENSIQDLKTFRWFDGLDQVRKEALIDMMFNLGRYRFNKFQKMIKALEEKDYLKASQEMLNSKWREQVGHRAIELARMIESGEYYEI